jgi:ABC-type transport system involved in multi-copper enzyme maturation permease subunit
VSFVVMTETLRRHFAHLGYVAALLVLIVIVVTMAAVGAPSQAPYEMISLFTLIAGCQLIGPEFSKGTLQLILSKPVGRSSYVVGRVVGVVLAIWVAVIVIFASFSRSFVNVGIYIGGQILISMIFGLLTMMKNAVTGEMGVIGAFLRAHPGVVQSFAAIRSNVFPEDPVVPFDRNWILMMLCNASVALLLACVIFSRREVPYGAD